MKVGITILLKEDQNIWTNGINQNCLMFYRILERIPEISSVKLLQIGSLPTKINWYFDGYEFDVMNHESLSRIRDEYDLIITLGGLPHFDWMDYFKTNPNNRLVMYKGGNEFINKIEMAMYGQYKGWPDVKVSGKITNPRINFIDQVWMVPQQEFHNKEYFEIVYNCDTTSVPFVWSPEFLQQHHDKISSENITAWFDEKPEFNSWRWTSFEPNMSILKNMMPIIYSMEWAYRNVADKSIIEKFIITNAAGHRDNIDLMNVLHDFDAHRDNKFAFDGRYPLPYILSTFAEGVVSHQWGNPLNYAYLDVSYFGIPLVHNAHLCQDLGYYYEGWKVKDAGKLMLRVMDERKNDDTYTERQHKILERYLPNYQPMLDQYRNLILGLWEERNMMNLQYNWKTNLLE